jgi:2-polyprenyl-3-methyl-5-hydroxy-6-metoxy-1,4-benzoquinol methylase/glycosyltransferase involved in cell wall biosynthesis
MIALNEEKNIERALRSCNFADEIVVVDGGSTDSTLDILRSHDTVVLIQCPWENHFGRQRQVSLEHCTGDWVIRLDADEAFSCEFEENIRALLSSSSADVVGYKTRQCNLIGNENHYSKTYDIFERVPRIFKNLTGIKWEGHIHEILVGLITRGQVPPWDVYVVHYGFLDKKRYWEKGVYYSTIPESGFKGPDGLCHREYDIQPRPARSAVAPHVPQYTSEEYTEGLPGIAIIRGTYLTNREMLNYEPLTEKFNITCYSTNDPGFDGTHVKLPFVKLPARKGNPDFMEGLEFELFDKDIICSADITRVFTYQAVAAKLKFEKKVIALGWENVPFAGEDNEAVREIKEINRKYVDVFVAGSRRAKDAIMLEGVPEEKIVIIPMGIDIDRFKPDEEARRKTRKEAGIKEEEMVVLFTGRMAWEKGIYDLVYAAKLVTLDQAVNKIPLRFVVAGEGPEHEEIRRTVNKLGMNDVFIFRESCPYHQMHELFNAADIFVLPSIATRTWKEQQGVALIAAMACGTPVISTSSGSLDEVVGDAGILVQSNDPTGLSAAIINLLKDDVLRDELAAKGRERAVNEYDSRKIALRYSTLFEEVLRSTFKGAVRELAEYTRITEQDIFKRIRSVYSQQIREWKGIIGDKLTDDKVNEFYRNTDSYLFDLVQFNYENSHYMQLTEEVFSFCASLNRERGGLKIIDFGGGIGSQMISLSVLKGAELSYADIPGKTFEYAKWRFRRRQIEIDMIDASKEDFLADRMYDVVITLDVIEHLVSPETTVGYLAKHINPGGYLVVLTSFIDNNGEAGWHLNVDRYTDEAFYNFIKTVGMDMINQGYPRIFQKNEQLVSIIEGINSARREGRFADSRKYMESYLELRPVDLDMLVKYADVCLMLGDRDTASENLEKVRLFNPDMPEALKIAEKIRRMDNEINDQPRSTERPIPGWGYI